MATAVKRRRGTTVQHSTFIGQLGELTVDTDKKTVVVHNGATAGGFPLRRQFFVNTKEYGALGDGVADDYAALQAAIDAVEVQALLTNSLAVLDFSPGIYNTSQPLVIDGNYVQIKGNRAKIVATGAIGSVLTVGNAAAGACIQMLVVDDLILDADGVAASALWVREGQNLQFNNCRFSGGTTQHVYVEGSGNSGDIRVLNILFNNCLAADAGAIGYHFKKNGNIGAFDRITLVSCGAEGGTSLIKADGDFGMQIIGGTFHNGTVAGLYADGATVGVLGAYFENASYPPPTLLVDNGAKVTASNTTFASQIQYDDTDSVVILKDNTYANALGKLISTSRTGRLADRTDSWGSPVWPLGITGALHPKGLEWIDKMGTVWICTTSSPARYVPRDGRIIIPLPYTDLSNGFNPWWAMEDFVVTEMFLVIKTTFTGTSTFLKIGTYYDVDDINPATNGQENWISEEQGAIANLVAGNVISAKKNAVEGALLGPLTSGMRFLAGKGPVQNDGKSSSVRFFDDADWTAGLAYLHIHGVNQKYN